jgi:hypothetical protein
MGYLINVSFIEEKKSFWVKLNKEIIKELIKLNLMTNDG